MSGKWTPEKAQQRRDAKGWSPVNNRETKLPPSTRVAGRELAKMLSLSAEEFAEMFLKPTT